MNSDRLELLSVDLIQKYADKVKEIDRLCQVLWRGLGWHYLLDLIWILNILEKAEIPSGATIVDAGGGHGMLQYLLAERGYNVISVDYSPRRIPRIPSRLYDIELMGDLGVVGRDEYSEHIARLNLARAKLKQLRYRIQRDKFTPLRLLYMLLLRALGRRIPGRIHFYHADMMNMGELKDGSVNAVVSVSAMEHMHREDIPKAVQEFERILNPNGIMAITLSAARDDDWFSETAQGWCFAAATLRDLMDVSIDDLFSADDYDRVMAGLQPSQALIKRMSSSHFISGENGMPWGQWDPKYVPVGIVKTRNAN